MIASIWGLGAVAVMGPAINSVGLRITWNL